jgi:signal transduction histidine kinase
MPAAGNDDSVEQLHCRIAELTEAVAARDAFISVAGHDLRNAMTPIMGQVDLLMASVTAGKCSPQQVEQRLKRVQNTMIRYLKRARVLLDVSRLTSGKLRLDPETFDLSALLRDMARDLQAASRLSGASIQVAAPESLMVTLDQPATEQIVSSLVCNALQHGARTPIEVSAAVFGQQVHIQIRDHGGGISAADRSRVVDRFERAAQQEDRNGFSVGLWVVGQFVAAMDGTITIDDAPGGGALFTVAFPLHLKEFPH